MSEPFIGEIIMFAGDFAPRGWSFCDGQLLAISSHTALFAILATTYGGDGETTFGLPDLRGRAPTHEGSGPGLATYRLGQRTGAPSVALNTSNAPANHSHGMKAHAVVPDTDKDAPAADVSLGAIPGSESGPFFPNLYRAATNLVDMPGFTDSTGNGAAHNNRQPYLGINFIIALVGTFPPRN